ncbi:MAG: asparagine synthase-related protein [Pseudonocardiaceae bacterium]
MVRDGDHGAWWHQQPHHLTAGAPPRRTPCLESGDFRCGRRGGSPQRPWRALARCCAPPVMRPSPWRATAPRHLTLAILRRMGPAYRQLSQLYATAGLRLELPYFDDRVVEAALAVRLHERRTPWRYKPLLVEAMRPVLPEVIAARATKGEFGEDARVGFHRHLPEILEVFADSALAAHGVINPNLLRRELLAPQADDTVRHALEDLLGCETGCGGFWNEIRRWRVFPRFTALLGLDTWGVNCLQD